MKKSLLVATAVVGSMLFSGCATIVSGKTQKINVTSNKSVKVKINGSLYETPAIIEVKRDNKPLFLKVDETKCKQTILLNNKFNPVVLGDIVIGGTFGSTTDYATGAMWKYDDNVNIVCPQN